jgi:NAD(P)-dependent dehydrogenase (short-subunit alcohol dehydrogenase family)
MQRLGGTISLTILITGVSSGIGRATALELLHAGHTIYAGARRVETMDAIRASGGHVLSLDVTKEADLERAVNTMIDEQGRIDVLVNNAGSDTFGDVTVRAVRGYSGKGAYRELADRDQPDEKVSVRSGREPLGAEGGVPGLAISSGCGTAARPRHASP